MGDDHDPEDGWVVVRESSPCDDLDYEEVVEARRPDNWLDPYGIRDQTPSVGPGITHGLGDLFRRAGRPRDPDDLPTADLRRLAKSQETPMNRFRRKPTPPHTPAAPPPAEPPRDYTVAEIREDGWTPGAVAYVHRVLRECADAGVHACCTKHFELVELWEASATCWMERQAMLSTPEHRNFMTRIRERNREAATARVAMAAAGR